MLTEVLYLIGTCNITCAGLATDIENTTTFSIGSTITFYLTVKINLSPIDRQLDHSGFILHKNNIPLIRENVTFDRENFTYRLYNAQPADSGVYYGERISRHAILLTNRLFINVTNVSNLNPSITSQQLISISTSKYIYMYRLTTSILCGWLCIEK